jgi:hypothetical protein
MGPVENRTELERLLGNVWEYEDPGGRNTSLPKWLFAATLAGAVICTFSPSDVVAPVRSALAPASEKLSVDKVSSDNVAEDLDYRIARHAESPAGWRVFLEAHPDGPHVQAAQAEIDRQLTPSPPPVGVAEQSAPPPVSSAPPPVMVEEEPGPPPQPAEVAEQSPPSPVSPASLPVVVEKEPAPPAQAVAVAEQSLPSLMETQTPVGAAPSRIMAEEEQAPSEPAEAAASAAAPVKTARPRGRKVSGASASRSLARGASPGESTEYFHAAGRATLSTSSPAPGHHEWVVALTASRSATRHDRNAFAYSFAAC